MDILLQNCGFNLTEEYAKALDTANFKRFSSVLDVATGSGRMALALAQKNYKVLSCDISPEALIKAKARLGEMIDRVALQVMNAEAMPFKSNSLPAITCANALHEMDNPVAVLREIARIISPAGKLLVIDFNPFGFNLMERLHNELNRGRHPKGIMAAKEIDFKLRSMFEKVSRTKLSLNYMWVASNKLTHASG
jgi:ubiquinone/menaquinone biosynthesis C-methylase UbiE